MLDHPGTAGRAATIVAIVDTLTVCAPSAPLPTRSVIGPGMLIGVACASMPAARPDISSAVSPLARSPTPNPAIWAGDAAPSMISFIAQAVWLALSGWPLISARISAGQVGPSTDGGVTGAPLYPAVIAAARDRIRAASSLASATGSIGWLTTASARDQVASQRSSARAMTSSTGGQL